MNFYPFSRTQLYLALVIGLLAVIVRLGIFAVYPASSLAGGDRTAFWSYAQGIASGHGFRSTLEPWLADRPPLYSYFLAGVFLLLGENRQIVFVAQAVLGSVAALLFYLCAVRMMANTRGFIGGVIFAVWPHLLLFTKQILTEALYIPLLVMLIAMLVLPPKQDRLLYPQWIGAGVLLGLVALTRREAVLPASLIVLLFGWLELRDNRRSFATACIIIAIACGVVMTPWLVRNQIELGSPVLSSSGGVNFMVGNNPIAQGAYSSPPAEWNEQFAGLGELERDQKAWKLALAWIQEHPADFLRLIPLKFVTLWGPAHNVVMDGVDVILLPFYILGLARVIQHRQGWQAVSVIALTFIICISLVGMAFVGAWRYRLAVYPGLVLLAAFGIPDLWLEKSRQSFECEYQRIFPHTAK